MPNPSQDSPAPTIAPNQDSMDMDVIWTFKSKIVSQKLDHVCIKDQQSYPNQDQDCKPPSGTSSILQNPKSEVKGQGCLLHFQNHDRALIQNINLSKTNDAHF